MRNWATRRCTALDFYLSGRCFCRQTGVTAYLSLCPCGCVRTLTWLFVLTTDSSSIRVLQTHVQPLLKQPSRPKSQCSECVSVFCVTVLTYLWSAPQQQKQALSPSSSSPLLSVQPAPFKHVTVAASPQAGLIIPRPGPARHVCTSGLRAILCVLDTKM